MVRKPDLPHTIPLPQAQAAAYHSALAAKGYE